MKTATLDSPPRPDSAAQAQSHARARGRLAWVIWILTMVLTALGLFLLVLTLNVPVGAAWAPRGVEAPFVTIFATVGALIASRQLRNWVGWLFLWMGLGSAFLFAADGYSVYALIVSPGALPFGLIFAWLNNWLWVLVAIPAGVLPLLLLPNGHLLSPRWLVVVGLTVVVTVAVALVFAFAPGNLSRGYTNLANPFGVAAPGSWLLLGTLGIVLSLACLAAGVLALILRLRRARETERLQLKWIVYATALLALIFPMAVLPDQTLHLIFLLAGLGIPIAVGIAILRYNLYDIDLLINRTLVYVPLTAILAGVFTATVTLSQKFVALLGASSDAATVITTLVVVTAFTPLKDRLQVFVDKNFKDAPDPSKELAALSAQIRSVIEVTRVEPLTRRLVETATHAFDAQSGAVFLGGDGAMKLMYASDKWDGEARLSVSLEVDSKQLGQIALSARRHGAAYTAKDREALQQLAVVAAQAIAEDRKT